MLFESARQAPLFAVFFCLGAALGIFYELLYPLRKKGKGVMLYISDAVFSVVFFLGVTATTLLFNYGKLEIYFFIGIFLGFCAERTVLSGFIKIFMDFWMKIIYNLYIRLGLDKCIGRLLK